MLIPLRWVVLHGLLLLLAQVAVGAWLVRYEREYARAICRATLQRNFGLSKAGAEDLLVQEERIWKGG